ncbi:hypothetical protein PoB_000740500 [Plakobranchus ocellatus]|uniref:Uncharacterized protein n=1 Tax=Plakobranchus ocellatus TaxID=259542 RepID=A0AAV3YCY4_9GAST|nr:hypothetical protein PoB_000740500 [Plakobranchus ocellatus]
MAPPFPLSDRTTDIRPGCKTQRIAPTVRQVADLVCARTKERENFKTCIVGHVNCCLQCGPTLTATSILQVSHDKSRRLQCGFTLNVLYPPTSYPDNLRNKTGLVIRAAMVSRIIRGHVMAPPFPLSNRATDVRPGCKTLKIAPTLRQVADLVCARTKEKEYSKTCIVGHVNCCLQCGPWLTPVGLASVSFYALAKTPQPHVAVWEL